VRPGRCHGNTDQDRRGPAWSSPSTMTTLSDPAAPTQTRRRAGAAPSYFRRAGSANSFARSRRRHHSRRTIPAATQIRAMMVCAPVIRRTAPTMSSPRTVRPEDGEARAHEVSVPLEVLVGPPRTPVRVRIVHRGPLRGSSSRISLRRWSEHGNTITGRRSHMSDGTGTGCLEGIGYRATPRCQSSE